MKIKIIILSTILLFCILPVANANNGNAKIKFIRESVTSSNMSRSISEQNLSGVGFEFYGNLRQDSGWVVNQVKSNKEKLLEEQLAKESLIKAAEIAHKAYESGKTVREIALEENVLPKKEIDALLDPKNMIKPND